MQIIRRNKSSLERLNSAKIREMFEKLRSVYAAAYGWQPEARLPNRILRRVSASISNAGSQNGT